MPGFPCAPSASSRPSLIIKGKGRDSRARDCGEGAAGSGGSSALGEAAARAPTPGCGGRGSSRARAGLATAQRIHRGMRAPHGALCARTPGGGGQRPGAQVRARRPHSSSLSSSRPGRTDEHPRVLFTSSSTHEAGGGTANRKDTVTGDPVMVFWDNKL